jgi:hypothetical protein
MSMANIKKITVLVVSVMCIGAAAALYKIITYEDDSYIEGGDIQKSINTHQN